MASNCDFVERPGRSAAHQGYLALLVGIALRLSCKAYHHITRIDPNESETQPDVPRWLPIRGVLEDIPTVEDEKLLG